MANSDLKKIAKRAAKTAALETYRAVLKLGQALPESKADKVLALLKQVLNVSSLTSGSYKPLVEVSGDGVCYIQIDSVEQVEALKKKMPVQPLRALGITAVVLSTGDEDPGVKIPL